MATCRPTLFLLTVKEILLVHFIITNFRVAHKMLCTPRLRNPLTTSRLSCLGRKAALTTIFLSVRQSRISQPCYTNNYFSYVGYVNATYYKNEPFMVNFKFAKFHCYQQIQSFFIRPSYATHYTHMFLG
jgi:hypothetical protein